MTVRNARFEDMALAAKIMVTSFRTAFEAFVSPETMDECTNPANCRAMLEHIYEIRGSVCQRRRILLQPLA